MEHILQFGISIDDKYIANTAMQKASEQIKGDVLKVLNELLFKDNGYYKKTLSKEAQDIIMQVFHDEMEDKIIDMVVDKLVASLRHSKKYKDALGKLSEEEE